MSRTQLYHHYDKAGNLLYVGVSLSAANRLSQHKSNPWFDRIATVSVRTYETRKEALGAERADIAALCPLYNKMGNGWSSVKIPTRSPPQPTQPRDRSRFRYLKIYNDRHGKQRCYLRKRGLESVLIKSGFGSPDFEAEYFIAVRSFLRSGDSL